MCCTACWCPKYMHKGMHRVYIYIYVYIYRCIHTYIRPCYVILCFFHFVEWQATTTVASRHQTAPLTTRRRPPQLACRRAVWSKYYFKHWHTLVQQNKLSFIIPNQLSLSLSRCFVLTMSETGWNSCWRSKDIHSSIHLSIHPFIHPSIHPSIYPSIHPSSD